MISGRKSGEVQSDEADEASGVTCLDDPLCLAARIVLFEVPAEELLGLFAGPSWPEREPPDLSLREDDAQGVEIVGSPPAKDQSVFQQCRSQGEICAAKHRPSSIGTLRWR